MERDKPEPQGKFELGQIVGTPGAVSAFERAGQNPLEFIARHWTGDWGDFHYRTEHVSVPTRLLRAAVADKTLHLSARFRSANGRAIASRAETSSNRSGQYDE